METLGVLDEARHEILTHTDSALAGLRVLPDTPARAALLHVVARMARRGR